MDASPGARGVRARSSRTGSQSQNVPDACRPQGRPRRARARPRPDVSRGSCGSIRTATRLDSSGVRCGARARGTTHHGRGRCSLHRRRLLGRRLNRRRLHRLAWRRQKRQGVDVAVRVRRVADAQVDIRLVPLGLAARADRADVVPLGDLRPDGHADRAEVDERHRPAVRSPNGQAEPLVWHSPREGDDPARGGPDVRARRRADVDPAVLAARIGIAVGHERPQHRPVDRPAPRRSPRREHQGSEQRTEEDVAGSENHAARVPRRSAVVKYAYSEAR